MDKIDASALDQALVLRLIEGDEAAFCQLYSRYKDRLMFFAMKFLKSTDYAEDVLQDVFTNIWTGRKLINPEIPFAAYLFTIVKNRVLNQIRDMEKQELLKNRIMEQAIDYNEVTQLQYKFDLEG